MRIYGGFNPYWVFQCAATYPDLCGSRTQKYCFNPYWVFQCAATNSKPFGISFISKFQSLLGFPMRCDVLIANQLGQGELVSIPSGFSNALRRMKRPAGRRRGAGFNPYWVFQCAATFWICLATIRKIRFNPYWVFQCAATGAIWV